MGLQMFVVVVIIVMTVTYCIYDFVMVIRKHRKEMAALDRTEQMLELVKEHYEAQHGSIWDSRDQWRTHVTRFLDRLGAHRTNEKTREGLMEPLTYPNEARYKAVYGFNQRPPIILRRRVDEWYLLLLAMQKSHQTLPAEITQYLLSFLVDRCYKCNQCYKVEPIDTCIVNYDIAMCSKRCHGIYFMWVAEPERYVGQN